jgi:hypothetical protein
MAELEEAKKEGFEGKTCAARDSDSVDSYARGASQFFCRTSRGFDGGTG